MFLNRFRRISNGFRGRMAEMVVDVKHIRRYNDKHNIMYILLINIHGLVRSGNIEFGRDADTGGQTRYIIDLAKTLGTTPGVDRVDLVTRLIGDKTVSDEYSEPEEPIEGVARIVRLSAGGSKYIRKERLWPFLDEFSDRLVSYLRRQDTLPDIIHGHYADAGYVAERVAGLFGKPLVFSGHSLGRNKLEFLKSQGWSEDKADERFSIKTRIRCEERILSRADLVIASTSYERDELYGMYDRGKLPRYEIIPPGLDLDSFFPYYEYTLPGDSVSAEQKQAHMRMLNELRRFHFEPEKPLIITLCRPDARKNIDRLIEVYGEDRELQAMANLAIFAGIRDDITSMEEGERQVLTDILLAMDRYDLYGKMAIPKNHDPGTDVPEMYRIAALSHGVFVSASYLETFGLTFIEASAAGLPFIATNKGGPVDIAANLKSGALVDIEDREQTAGTIKRILTDTEQWNAYSENGINQTRKIYSWKNHVDSYLKALKSLPTVSDSWEIADEHLPTGVRFRQIQNLLIVDIDDTLIGDDEGTAELIRWLKKYREKIGFGVATGRPLDSARTILEEKGVPAPDLWIVSVGSEIYYGPEAKPDKGWRTYLSRRWKPEVICSSLESVDGIRLQDDDGAQREYKISFDLTGRVEERQVVPAIHTALTRKKLWYTLVVSHGRNIDILPYRGSKGKAIRYISQKWGIPLDSIVTAGNSGNDRDMLTGSLRGIVVGNHEKELASLRKSPGVYFAGDSYSRGILEGLQRYLDP